MVTDVFVGGGAVSTIGKTYPSVRGLLRFYSYRKVSLLFAKSFLIRVCGSMMFRRLQERVFVIRKNSNSPRGLEFLFNGYRNTTLSFGKRSTRLGKTNWYDQIL